MNLSVTCNSCCIKFSVYNLICHTISVGDGLGRVKTFVGWVGLGPEILGWVRLGFEKVTHDQLRWTRCLRYLLNITGCGLQCGMFFVSE